MSIGLDIGSKSVKVIELVKEGGNWRLKASGIVGYSGLTPDKIQSDKDMVPLVDAIRKLFREAKLSSKDVAISLPETQVFTRTVKFPLLTDSEIASAVRWEAEQYIPIPIEEAVLDYEIIDRLENATPPQVQIFLIAASKKLIEKYVRLVQACGLFVSAVETDLIALSRSLGQKEDTVMIADFGARSTNLAIVKRGNLCLSRSVPTAGEAFTRAVSQGLGIEAQQAEEYKRTYGLSSSQLEGRIRGVLDPVFRMVADEMKKSIQYYVSENEGGPPKSAFLSGGTSGMPELVSTLTNLLGIEVIIGNPFSKIIVDPEAAKILSGYSPLYSIAVGLAMR